MEFRDIDVVSSRKEFAAVVQLCEGCDFGAGEFAERVEEDVVESGNDYFPNELWDTLITPLERWDGFPYICHRCRQINPPGQGEQVPEVIGWSHDDLGLW